MAFKINIPLHLHATGHTGDPKDPKKKYGKVTDPKDSKTKKVIKKVIKKKKVTKVTQKITPSTKKKVSATYDRFANYRNVPGAEPIGFRPDGSVTMIDKNGHTYGLKRPDPK